MALRTGISVSRILLLAGAGYTGAILIKNGKLSELIGELQALVKGIEKSGEQSGGDSDNGDAVAQQVRRLAMEVRQTASARQFTVIGGSGQTVNLSGFIIPAATLGALGYGYMWWKGLKFSDLMYVTKRNMAAAVSNLTKHLEQVSEALSAAKTHLTQRIQHLDDKMESQKEMSKQIQNDVNCATANLQQIDGELQHLQESVFGLDLKMCSLEEKQDFANKGVWYLCNFVGNGGKKMEMPKFLEVNVNHGSKVLISASSETANMILAEVEIKPSGRTHTSLTYSEVPSLTGLKQLADSVSQTISEPPTVVIQDGIDIVADQLRSSRNDQPRPLLRINSARC